MSSEPGGGAGTLFRVAAQTWVPAGAADVYSLVSDLSRSGVWSQECLGGEWVHGVPAAVGSVFKGRNFRKSEVVGWAPVVRGEWVTEAEVVAADPGREFGWAMRDGSGRRQQSVWSFALQAESPGTLLVHRFWMGEPTEGIRGITAEMTAAERVRFVSEWSEKIDTEMRSSVQRIREYFQ